MVKPYYYYYKDKNNKPIITVCAIIDTTKVMVLSRGVAICHPKDSFCKEIGKRISFNRANAVILGKKKQISQTEFRDEIDRLFDIVPKEDVFNKVLDFKGSFFPKETEIEKCLLNKITKPAKNRNQEVIVYQEDDGEIN